VAGLLRVSETTGWRGMHGRIGYWDLQVRYHLGEPNLPRHHRPEDPEAV
jgi:hypothetical protein